MPQNTFWIARSLFIRGLGALYFLGALIILFQMRALIGEAGLSPIPQNLPQPWDYPSLLLFYPSDSTITALGWAQLLAALPLILGFVNWPLLVVLYVCQLSFVNGGGIFYGFGWETMICELTFLSLFITHPWRLRLNSIHNFLPGRLNLALFWWLLVKLMIGAGLIKLRGDTCWTDFTCMDYHYQTQPNPNPISWLYHNLPFWFHRFEVVFNHFVELIVPIGLLLPRRVRIFSGLLIAFFQGILISSGNLAYINWQTLVLVLTVFDDRFFRGLSNFFFPKFRWSIPGVRDFYFSERLMAGAGIALCALLSLPVLKNLISPQQSMNESYSRFHLVNSYGLFGGITKERFEIIISGTAAAVVTPQSVWQEYEFYCKPGRIDRRPCWISPYHLRLDWQMWFSAMRPEMQERWLTSLAEMMLRNDKSLEDLLIENPFSAGPAPKFIKMDLYRYRFTAFDEGNSNWWRREFVKEYMAPAKFR